MARNPLSCLEEDHWCLIEAIWCQFDLPQKVDSGLPQVSGGTKSKTFNTEEPRKQRIPSEDQNQKQQQNQHPRSRRTRTWGRRNLGDRGFRVKIKIKNNSRIKTEESEKKNLRRFYRRRCTLRLRYVGCKRFYANTGQRIRVLFGLIRSWILHFTNINPFPSKEPRIHGPLARSQQRQSDSDGPQKDVGPGISGFCNAVPYPQHRHQRSGDGRPQAREQKYSGSNPERIWNEQLCGRRGP